MNKLIIPIIAIAIIAAGIGAFFIFQKPVFPEPPTEKQPNTTPITTADSNSRDYFYEVHMEPSHENDEMFEALKNFVELANKHKIKLTLLFSPQWAEMILKDKNRLDMVSQWQNQGHEIGGHHHGPNTCPWDGYTNLDLNGEVFKISQSRIPCLAFIRSQEKYLGNMQEFVNILNKLAGKPIKVFTISNENQDWPGEDYYAAGGNALEEAISKPHKVNFSGYEVIKVSSATLLAKKSVKTGEQITVQQLKDKFLSSQAGIFGVVSHEVDYKDNPQLYEEWFNFLNSQDPSGGHSYTVSEIIEKHYNDK